MADNSLINLGDLSKPATVLIEKISDAIGVVYEPKRIRREAEAKAEAAITIAKSNIQITQLQQRAMQRFVAEEASKQENIESIIEKTLPNLNAGANTRDLEKDWITNFFDQSRLISDEEMQYLWAKMLAGEGNEPGTFSKRTVNLVASLDKRDVKLFSALVNYAWTIGRLDDKVPLVFEPTDDIYAKNGIDFKSLKHLDSLGLISFDNVGGYQTSGFDKIGTINYQGVDATLVFTNEENNSLSIGKVILTTAGVELANICNPTSVDGLREYVLGKIHSYGVQLPHEKK
jgi:hypothetical protein